MVSDAMKHQILEDRRQGNSIHRLYTFQNNDLNSDMQDKPFYLLSFYDSLPAGTQCPSETAHWEHTVGLTCYIADSVVTTQCGEN